MDRLPATELFRLALQNGASAVAIDGGGPDELQFSETSESRLARVV
jgi:hypothetical protein